jgi:hypothetical protein
MIDQGLDASPSVVSSSDDLNSLTIFFIAKPRKKALAIASISINVERNTMVDIVTDFYFKK